MAGILVWGGLLVMTVTTLWRGCRRAGSGPRRGESARGPVAALVPPAVAVAALFATHRLTTDALLPWLGALYWGVTASELLVIRRARVHAS
ncbi:hypothetical protein [Streptomyces sp. ICBB 8177]|uniref:hypothetical protein n=1 Tax=Streptomyces sp. ICBB 8177 TaxID=563922 RepID=UPI000D674C16|nr:hypothetical protein [Streptomyces sp. ICBB 8177]PWI43223.1 hypothetical protein CK485_13675 [Streptomyces sp. ICBB 8177]